MAVEARHVRFRISELVVAATRVNQAASMLTDQEALTFYWNWARARGWKLRAMTSQIDKAAMRVTVCRDGQVEAFSPEENWNVMWEGETTDGCPDLVAEDGLAAMSQEARFLYLELFKRGWSPHHQGLFKDGRRIEMEAIIEGADRTYGSIGGEVLDELRRDTVGALNDTADRLERESEDILG